MKILKLNLLAIVFIGGFSLGCQGPSQSEQEDRRKEQAGVEAEEQSKADQEKQNAQSLKLEAEFQRRYRFYSALSFEYLGQIKEKDKDNKDIDVMISLTLKPTVPLYTGDRIRTVEEVQTDLQNLGFQSSIRFWNKDNFETAVGCDFADTKAFYENGVVRFHSPSECASVFQLSLLSKVFSIKEIEKITQQTLDNEASVLAQRILRGEVQSAPSVFIRMQSTYISKVRAFQLKKKTSDEEVRPL